MQQEKQESSIKVVQSSFFLCCLSWDGLGAARNAGCPGVMSDTCGAVNLKTTSRLFSQVLGCRRPAAAALRRCCARLDHQRSEHRSTLCLSCWPRPNYAAQEMKRGRCSLPGSRQGLRWLGGLRWRPFPLLPPPASPRSPWVPSSPLAPGQWAILGALEGPVQPFNPWPDLLSGEGVVLGSRGVGRSGTCLLAVW